MPSFLQESVENGQLGPEETAERLTRWMKRSCDQRLNMLWDTIYNIAAIAYQKPNYRLFARFNSGDHVLVYKDDLFWNAKIVGVSKAAVLCVDAGKPIPAYKIKYIGWHEGFSELGVAEWDAWATSGPHMYSFQMLYAYFWNQHMISKLGPDDIPMESLKGLFDPPIETVQLYEERWRSEANGYVDIPFADFVGMPLPDKENT